MEDQTRFDAPLPRWHEEIFVDPQTNGGLLAAVAAEEAAELVAALSAAGVGQATLVGRVEPLASPAHVVFA